MPKCAIKRCTNNKLKVQKKEGISYFRFPQNAKRRERWRRAVARDRGERSFTASAHSVICSRHFSEQDMYSTERGLKRLRRTALPCLQMDDGSGRVSSPVAMEPQPPGDPLGPSKWRRQHDYRLVALYQAQECLWRPACASYRDRAARRAAWASVAAGMGLAGLTVADVQAEMRYLRSVYATERARLERSLAAGAGDAYEPELLVFADLHCFLKDVVDERPHPDEEPVIKVEYEQECGEEEGEADSVSVSAQGAWRESSARREGAARREDAEEECAVFARHVGTQLGRLPLESSLLAQEEIQRVLTRHRLRCVTDDDTR